jgi:hypothetical protein
VGPAGHPSPSLGHRLPHHLEGTSLLRQGKDDFHSQLFHPPPRPGASSTSSLEGTLLIRQGNDDFHSQLFISRDEKRTFIPNLHQGPYVFLFSVVFTSSPPPSHHGSVWVQPVISLLLTNTISPLRACLSIGLERFRGTEKEDECGSLKYSILSGLHPLLHEIENCHSDSLSLGNYTVLLKRKRTKSHTFCCCWMWFCSPPPHRAIISTSISNLLVFLLSVWQVEALSMFSLQYLLSLPTIVLKFAIRISFSICAAEAIFCCPTENSHHLKS